jgi:DNA-binding transcriptional ArsR family regulator
MLDVSSSGWDLQDVIATLSVVITVAFVVISFFLLSRYRKLLSSANESGALARDLWEALDGRFKKQNERIIDLMARMEVYDAQSRRSRVAQPLRGVLSERRQIQSQRPLAFQREEMLEESIERDSSEVEIRVGGPAGIDILRAVLQGPKTSVEITRVIGKSREHTARLMKVLFENGLVERDTRNKPFVYTITEKGRHQLGRG